MQWAMRNFHGNGVGPTPRTQVWRCVTREAATFTLLRCQLVTACQEVWPRDANGAETEHLRALVGSHS